VAFGGSLPALLFVATLGVGYALSRRLFGPRPTTAPDPAVVA
jgi:hypothetical protein